MIRPETANVGSEPGLLFEPVSCISRRRPGQARPGRGGEAGVGQRTHQMARGCRSSGGAGDRAASRRGRDRAAPRLGYGAPAVGRLGLSLQLAPTGECRRDCSVARHAAAPPAGRAREAQRPAHGCCCPHAGRFDCAAARPHCRGSGCTRFASPPSCRPQPDGAKAGSAQRGPYGRAGSGSDSCATPGRQGSSLPWEGAWATEAPPAGPCAWA